MNQDQLKSAIQHGRILELNRTDELGGARVTPIRASKRTANVSCLFAEDWAIYKKGESIHVPFQELEEMKRRPAELEKDYHATCKSVQQLLEHIVWHGLKARQKVAADILVEAHNEVLADVMRWGKGVTEDLKATIAQRVLSGIEEYGLEIAMQYTVEGLQRSLANNEWSGGSSSSFSNAVEEVRRSVARDMVRELGFELRELRRARALIEVL